MKAEKADGIGSTVRAFYEDCSFPGYESFETPEDLMEKSKRGLYAQALDAELPLGVRVLDAGCGTGQLAVFLSMTHRQVVGIDFSLNSLRRGNGFKGRFGLKNVSFAQMDLFRLALREQSFDYIFCNGVLHHTADPYGAFEHLVPLLKPNGVMAIGLYNPWGRFFLEARKVLFKMTGGRLAWLDWRMRDADVGDEKKRIWFRDQYQHPRDASFTVDQVLQWFERNGIRYLNSVPPITLGQKSQNGSGLFKQGRPGSFLEHLLIQTGWIFTLGKEGGYFITIGQKIPNA